MLTVNQKGITYYAGISHTWQCTEFGNHICLSPVMGSFEKQKEAKLLVPISPDTKVLQDSGAFSDSLKQRLPLEKAYERQETHAFWQGYSENIEYQVTYDLLIDETWIEESNKNKRWSIQDTEYAMNETVKAAAFYATRSKRNLCMSLQGVDSFQYHQCAEKVLNYYDPKHIIGLGGWCNIGRQKTLYPEFVKTMEKVFPLFQKFCVSQIHIFGVLWAKALGTLLWMADQYGIRVSTDSTGPVIRPMKGAYGYAEWRREIPKPKGVRNKIELTNAHVKEVIYWLDNFRGTKWYGPPLTG